MPNPNRTPQFTPGEVVLVADLEVGDLIYARRNRLTRQPSAPVRVKALTPSIRTTGLVNVLVQSVYDGSPWPMGYMRLDKTFPRAVAVSTEPQPGEQP